MVDRRLVVQCMIYFGLAVTNIAAIVSVELARRTGGCFLFEEFHKEIHNGTSGEHDYELVSEGQGWGCVTILSVTAWLLFWTLIPGLCCAHSVYKSKSDPSVGWKYMYGIGTCRCWILYCTSLTCLSVMTLACVASVGVHMFCEEIEQYTADTCRTFKLNPTDTVPHYTYYCVLQVALWLSVVLWVCHLGLQIDTMIKYHRRTNQIFQNRIAGFRRLSDDFSEQRYATDDPANNEDDRMENAEEADLCNDTEPPAGISTSYDQEVPSSTGNHLGDNDSNLTQEVEPRELIRLS